jgi:hypothetical protein
MLPDALSAGTAGRVHPISNAGAFVMGFPACTLLITRDVAGTDVRAVARV